MLPHWKLTILRRRVFWIASALYVVILPFLLAYALGVHVDVQADQPIVMTSSFFVTTLPSGATVQLEGKEPKPTPAAFENLTAGSHMFKVNFDGARSWEGLLEAKEGVAYSLSQLRMVSTQSPYLFFSFTSQVDPVLFDDDHSVAYVPPGENAVIIASLKSDKVEPTRIAIPGLGTAKQVTLQMVELSGHLVISGYFAPDFERRSVAIDLRGLNSFPQVRNVPKAIRMAPDSVALLSVSPDQGESVTLQDATVVRSAELGSSSTLLHLDQRVLAYGYLYQRWYVLDNGGHLYQYGAHLPPLRIATMDTADCSACGSGEIMRILSASDQMVACVDPVGRTLFVLSPNGYDEYLGFEGGQPSSQRGEYWVWNGVSLYLSRLGGPPRRVAEFGGKVLGVEENFSSHAIAVDTEAGVYLIPSVVLAEEAVSFKPLLLAAAGQGVHTYPAGDRTILRRNALTGLTQAYRLKWSAP